LEGGYFNFFYVYIHISLTWMNENARLPFAYSHTHTQMSTSSTIVCVRMLSDQSTRARIIMDYWTIETLLVSVNQKSHSKSLLRSRVFRGTNKVAGNWILLHLHSFMCMYLINTFLCFQSSMWTSKDRNIHTHTAMDAGNRLIYLRLCTDSFSKTSSLYVFFRAPMHPPPPHLFGCLFNDRRFWTIDRSRIIEQSCTSFIRSLRLYLCRFSIQSTKKFPSNLLIKKNSKTVVNE